MQQHPDRPVRGLLLGEHLQAENSNRTPKPTSRSVTALVSGVYGYAEYENMLPLLAELCGVEATGRASMRKVWAMTATPYMAAT